MIYETVVLKVMSDHDMMVSKESNAAALERNGREALNDDQDLGLEHYHGLELKQTHGNDALDLGRRDEHECYGCEDESSVDRKVEDMGRDLGLEHYHGLELEHENDGLSLEQSCADECYGVGTKNEHAGQDSELEHYHGLVLKQHNHGNDDLELRRGVEYGLSLEQPCDVNKKHEHMDQDSFVWSHDLNVEENALVVAENGRLNESPIIQPHMVVESPNYELTVGQEFPDALSCRQALRDTAIALRFEIQTIKSDSKRFTAKCASEGCPWRIHVAKLPGVPIFSIRTLHEQHTCGGIAHLGHQQASVQWVANTVEGRLKENPNCKPKEILEEIHRTHGITLSYKQAWRGKERIMAAIRGSYEDGYRLLPQYCEQLKRTNPGSMACVYGSPEDNSFQRLFVSFQASIYGFINACRPLIGLARTTLKSKYLETLLLATGFDGEGALFPIAFGLVDEENEDNWKWFLLELRNLLEVSTENMPRLTILSDRQKGIVEGVEAYFPTAFHGFCMLHLSDHFQKEFKNPMLVHLLWEAAQALTVRKFHGKMIEIEHVSQEAAYWIQSVPAHLWATAYFEGVRFGQLTVNIVEYLNGWLLEASSLPILQTMECIRRKLMTLFNERREASMQWSSILVPSAERRVAESIELAHTCEPIRANDAEFEVLSPNGTNIVDIKNRSCSCRGWQLYGVPCTHAAAALVSCGQNVERFTDNCFTVASYRKAYSQTIHLIPDKSMWKESFEDENVTSSVSTVINPPKTLRPAGRPIKRRIRPDDNGRAKRIVHCGRCNQTGHFRTTCTTPL